MYSGFECCQLYSAGPVSEVCLFIRKALEVRGKAVVTMVLSRLTVGGADRGRTPCNALSCSRITMVDSH